VTIAVSHAPPSAADDSQMWWATRYVLGELTSAEAAAWEARLADDEQACAVVAEASRLMLGLQAALQVPAVVMTVAASSPAKTSSPLKNSHSPRRSAFGPTLTMLMTTAVAVVFACWLGWSSPSRGVDDGSAVALVELWRDGDPLTRGVGNDADVDEVAEMDPAADGVTVPNWLLAAVSLERSRRDSAGDDVWEDN